MDASGKTVLITGGGSGIGLEIARQFVAEGSKVVIAGRSLDRLEAAKQQIPELEVAQVDVTSSEQIEKLRDLCDERYGGIDVLVNNAGVFHIFDVAKGEVTLETQLNEIDIDFSGPVRMVHHFLPGLLKKPEAAIVNVSSGLAFVPYVAAPVYSATKAGVHSWTLSLRKQLSETNVQVVELMPPLVDTEMVEDVPLPKITPEKLATKFMKGFRKGKQQITPGQSAQLSLMSRVAPGFMLRMVNR